MPKRVPPLSAKMLATIRPQDHPVELVDGFVPGLRVRIMPSGTRTWSLNIRDSKGERRRFDVGAELGLAEARRRAEVLRQAVRDGADPTATRRAARQRRQAAKEGVGTLEALLDAYFTTGPGKERRRAAATVRLIKTVFAKALRTPLLDLKRPTLQVIADGWRSGQSAALAVRSVRPCLKWAERRDMAPAGISALEPPAAPRQRDRVLTTEEIKAIWPHLEGTHGAVVRWLFWTGCRLNEAVGMTWGEVHEGKWTIPANRSKSKRDRVVPLPTQAVALLQSLEAGDRNALVFPSSRGGRLSNWDRVTKILQERSSTEGWHRHDVRRTVATILGDLGVAPHILRVVLGHADVAAGATAVYARSRYTREHGEALQVLADYIEQLFTPDNVIRLSA